MWYNIIIKRAINQGDKAMTTIEKENGQIFEVYTNRLEFVSMIKDIKDDIWDDEDSSLYLVYADGSTIYATKGEEKKRINTTGIVKGIYSNPSTDAIYNCNIIYNERYEDYETDID
jgi:hypothetical protein